MRLIRSHNILPTIGLATTSAWISNPTVSAAIAHIISPKFAIATINIILILSASMIINDLYDTPIDIINNPDRPLITGAITTREAKVAIIGLLGLSEMLVMRFLPFHMQIGNHLSILGIILYTPFLKRMFLIKNLFCAGLVSYSLIFAAAFGQTTFEISNRGILWNGWFRGLQPLWLKPSAIASVFSTIFFYSFQKEILLDISDYEGDIINGIPTIATKYGRYNAFMVAYIILAINIFVNSWILLGMYGPIGILYSYIINPLLLAIPMIYIDHYSSESIEKYNRFSIKILCMGFLYFCVLSKLAVV